MSNMSNLVFAIQEDIEAGILPFRDIAEKYDIPFTWVDEIAKEYANQEE